MQSAIAIETTQTATIPKFKICLLANARAIFLILFNLNVPIPPDSKARAGRNIAATLKFGGPY
jgi:hypothetical protein